MINAQKYIEQCYMLERGAPRLKVYKEAINAANMEKDADNELEFMYSYISEAIFHDDNYKAVLMFPEYMALFDAHPEFQACHQLDFMRAFKYIIENVYDYYQISLEQVDKYFDEYKERCIKYGYSLRTYYMKYITFYSKCDRKKAEESFKLYKECKHDVLGDCDACEMNTDVEFELEFGTHEKALEIAAPILRGDKSCGEIPEMTYAKLISFYMYNGVYSEAEHYVRLLVPMIKGNIAYLLQRGILLSYYSQTQPYDGIKMFEENYPVALDTNNPRAHFHFYLGSYHLFSSIEMRIDVEELHLKMPKKFKLYDRENMYKIKELAEYFENECRKLAELFDARNKSDYYMNLYKTELKVQQNVSFQLPSHATVEPTESVMGVVPLKSDIVIDKDIISDLIDKSPDMELLMGKYADELYIHSSGREEYITAALAKERAGWIAKGFEQSGNALVMAEFELSDELQDEYDYEYEVMYVKVQAVNEDSITGVLLDTSDIVEELKENTEVTVKFENIMDFKVKYGEYMVTPDTVYLLAEQ